MTYSAAEAGQVAKSAALTSSVQLVHQSLLRSAADCDGSPVVFSARDGDQRTSQLGKCLAVLMRNHDISSSAGNNQGSQDRSRQMPICSQHFKSFSTN